MGITEQQVIECYEQWRKTELPSTDRTQRLGQYLMNNLLPHEANPSVYYERDDNKAMDMFMLQYTS